MAYWYRLSSEELACVKLRPLYCWDDQWHEASWTPPPGPRRVIVITNRQRAAVCIPGHPLYTKVHWFKRSDKRELYVNAVKTACSVLGSIQSLCETAPNYTLLDELTCWPYSLAAARLLFKAVSDKYAIKPAMKMVTEAVAPSVPDLIKSLLPCDGVSYENDCVHIQNPAWGAVASAMIASAIPWNVHFSMKPGSAFMRFQLQDVDIVKLTRIRCVESVNMIRDNPNLLPPELAVVASGDPIFADGSITQAKYVTETANVLGIVVIGRSASKIKERSAHFEAVVKRQLRTPGRSFPGPTCHSYRRDKGDQCIKCPLSGETGERHHFCKATFADTPADVLKRAVSHRKKMPIQYFEQVLLPPCLRNGLWSISHYGRFEAAIAVAKAFAN